MINYEVAPQILLSYLPAYTELDTFNGKMLVSLVGFMFLDTTVFGLRWPCHVNFEEVNLRFYVRHFDGQSWKRGVVFVSEIVPRPIIALMAKKLYHEPYTTMPMQHFAKLEVDQLSLTYKWKCRKNWNFIEVQADPKPTEMQPGSEAEFILEHYWGYNKYDQTTTIEYGVEHPRWQVQQVNDWQLDCNLASIFGQRFVPYLLKEPSSVLLAKGSEVIIRKPTFIKKGAR